MIIPNQFYDKQNYKKIRSFENNNPCLINNRSEVIISDFNNTQINNLWLTKIN